MVANHVDVAWQGCPDTCTTDGDLTVCCPSVFCKNVTWHDGSPQMSSVHLTASSSVCRCIHEDNGCCPSATREESFDSTSAVSPICIKLSEHWQSGRLHIT